MYSFKSGSNWSGWRNPHYNYSDNDRGERYRWITFRSIWSRLFVSRSVLILCVTAAGLHFYTLSFNICCVSVWCVNTEALTSVWHTSDQHTVSVHTELCCFSFHFSLQLTVLIHWLGTSPNYFIKIQPVHTRIDQSTAWRLRSAD